jgi:cell division inhibitor SepF
MGSWRKVGAFLGLVPEENRSYDGDEYDHREYDSRDNTGRDYADDYETADYRGSTERGRYRSSAEPEYAEPAGREYTRAEYPDPAYVADGYHEPAATQPEPARYARPRRGFAEEPVTQGALAMQPRVETQRETESATAVRPVTVKLTGFADARVVGEKYREGTSVILDMTEMDDSDARRLVDFAAGLAFAARGSIDKVTTKVFMLLPSVAGLDIDETRDAVLADARRMAVGAH